MKPKVVIIPTTRDRLFSRLEAGYGDIAIGAFKAIEAQRQSRAGAKPPSGR